MQCMGMKENQVIQVILAEKLAVLAHAGQNRKFGNSHVPFFYHPRKVAFRVSNHPRATPEMIAASYLHDTIEDASDKGFTAEYLLEKGVSAEVLEIVLALTNPSKKMVGATRAEKKAVDREHLKGQKWEVKLIKLVDRIDNMTDVVNDKETPADFVVKYKAESKLLLEVLRGTDAELEKELEELVK